MDYDFLLELAIIIFSTKFLGIIMRKLGLPQVIGALIAGLLISPSLLNWVSPSATLKILAELGVIMIMFSAGLETSLKDIKATGKVSLLVASMGVLLPLIFGFLISAAFHGGFDVNMNQIYQNIFVGIIITATSVSITVETLRELGKLKSPAGTVILSAAIIDDVIGIVLLSVVLGFKDPSVNPLITLGKTGAFFALAIVVGIGLYFLFKWLSARYPNRRRVPIFAFVICLLYAYCAEKFFGVADITGAYIAGISLSSIKTSPYIDKKIDVNAYMIFSPVFFASIGINASFNGFTLNILWFALAFVAVGILTKFLGCFLMSKALRMSTGDSLVIGVGMIARGEVALIVMQKGIASGLIGSEYLTIGVLLVLVSSLLAPILLRLIYKLRKQETISPPAVQPSTQKLL